MLNYYQVLGISENATQAEIKAAFKGKAIQYHPDKHAGDVNMEELFKEVNSAYQTLSNPYSKSRYDLSLKYGSFQAPPPPPPTYRRPPYSYQRGPFRPAGRRKYSSKENLRATFYAFLFAFVVGLIVKTGIWTLEYIRAEERAELLSERRLIYNNAKQANQHGDVGSSLEILSGLGIFDRTEMDMREYKEKLLTTTMYRANRYLIEENYQSALDMLNILEAFTQSASIDFQLKKAQAYKGIEDYENTLKIYEELHEAGYRTTSFYYEIGLTYEEGAQNFTSALQFYKVAAKYAEKEYESNIGKAYPIIISARYIPKLHYDIYMKLANAYYETNAYRQAIKSLRWTKEMWPDSALNYYISAKSHQALNEKSLACGDFNMAKFKDSTLDIPDICR